VVALSPGGGWERGSREQRQVERLFRRTYRGLRVVGPRADRLVRRPRMRTLLLRDVMARPRNVPPALAAQMIQAAADCPSYMPLVQAIKRDGPPEDLSGIDCPVRIAWGSRDRILPLKGHSPRLRRLVPDADFVELEGLGHTPMWDDPERIAQVILELTAAGRPAAAA
jgi:pimeloyl-ACP methyl ester carboxylesterase